MPFVDIRLADSTPREQKAAVVAAWRLLSSPGRKPAAAARIAISQIFAENRAAGGALPADRAATPQPREDAHAADTPR